MIIIYTTIDTLENANKLCNSLANEKLIACANYWQGFSVFRNNNIVTNTNEVFLFLKTTQILEQEVYHRLNQLHPYDVPAIFTIEPSEVSPAFINWLNIELELI